MKLAWKQIDPFVKSPDPKARVIVIYGPDDGLMRERSRAIGSGVVADLNDPFNVCVIDGDILLADPARLPDEAHAMSLMGGNRLIRIESASDKVAPIVKEYLDNPSSDNLVIIEAGELGPKSALRQLAEKAKNAAALPCYIDDERGAANVIRQMISEAGKRVDNDAAQWLAGAAVGDRGRVRAEVDKLLLYMGDENTIKIDHVLDACGEAGATSLDELVYATAGGQMEKALTAYHKLLEEGIPVITILRSLQNHFRKLHVTRGLMNEGLPVKEAMGQLQPPIFFKLEDSFISQLNRWKAQRLMAVMNRLSDIEADTKKTGVPAETLCAQAVMGIARL